MTTFILIALVWTRAAFQKPDSGAIQIEFDTKDKCEKAMSVVRQNYNVNSIKCLEIQK